MDFVPKYSSEKTRKNKKKSMVKKCSVQKTSREVELFSPGNGTSVTRAHVHDLYTRHAHTENWGELY